MRGLSRLDRQGPHVASHSEVLHWRTFWLQNTLKTWRKLLTRARKHSWRSIWQDHTYCWENSSAPIRAQGTSSSQAASIWTLVSYVPRLKWDHCAEAGRLYGVLFSAGLDLSIWRIRSKSQCTQYASFLQLPSPKACSQQPSFARQLEPLRQR